MPSEVASAYLTIMPSMKGCGKQIESQLGNVSVSSSGKKIGGSLVSGIAGTVAAGAGLIASAIGGIAISGGIARALDIEAARTKLSGLGHDAKSIQEIMNSANRSVKGTAFGLGEAAKVAAQMSAAGIAAGDDMTSVLSTIADTATIAGRSMGDVGNIFSSVAARGKLQGDDMLQLMSSGIPVLQMIGKQIGKTSAEVSKMVSDGEIDFETFASAMKAGMGGAALESGKTFTGALANVKAALSRIGEKFATPVLDGLRQIFIALKGPIDACGAALEPLAEAFGGVISEKAALLAEKINGLTDSFKGLSGGGILDLAPSISSLTQTLGVAGGAMAALSSGGLAQIMTKLPLIGPMLGGISGPLSMLAGPVGIAAAAFAGLIATTPELQAELGNLVQSLMPIGQALVQSLIPPIMSIASQIPIIVGVIGGAVTEIVAALAPLIVEIAGALVPAIVSIVDCVAQVVAAVVPVIAQAVGVIAPLIKGIIELIGPIVVERINQLVFIIQLAAAIVAEVFNAIAAIVKPMLDQIGLVINAFCCAASGDWDGAWNNIKAALDNAANFLKSVMDSCMAGLGSIVSSGVDGVVNFFSNLPSNILSMFSGAGSWLIDAGSNIMSGLLDGVKAGFEAVGDFVSGIGSWIAEHKGPKAYDLALLIPNGGWIMQSLATGLEAGMPKVNKALSHVADGISEFGATIDPVSANENIAYAYSSGARSASPATQYQDVSNKLDRIFNLMDSDSFGSVYIDGRKAGSVLARHVDSSLGAVSARRGSGL